MARVRLCQTCSRRARSNLREEKKSSQLRAKLRMEYESGFTLRNTNRHRAIHFTQFVLCTVCASLLLPAFAQVLAFETADWSRAVVQITGIFGLFVQQLYT